MSTAAAAETIDRPTTADGRRPRHPRTRLAFGRAGVVGGVLGAAVLAWVAVGPAALLLLGAFVLAAATGRWFPALHGPGAWAAGVVLTPTVVLAGSAAAALLAPNEHGRQVSWVLLAAPAVLGALALAVAARTGRGGPAAGSARGVGRVLTGVLPTVVVVGALVAAAVVAASGPLHDVAWAMSGDARNHVAITRSVIGAGGLTPESLTAYPAVLNALVAVVAGAADRAVAPGALILVDVRAVAAVYVLAAAATGTLLAGALVELVPRALRSTPRVVRLVAPVALVAAAAAGSPLVLGVALRDGFLSASGAVPLALAAIVLALRCAAPTGVPVPAFLLLLVALPLTFFAWTVLAVVPAALVVLVLALHATGLVRDRRRGARDRRVGAWVVAALAAAELAVMGGAVVVVWHRLAPQLVLPGTAESAHPFLLLVLVLAATAAGMLSGAPGARTTMLVPAVVGVVGVLTVLGLRAMPEGGVAWTYYAVKTNWLVGACLVWVPFALLVLRACATPTGPTGTPDERPRAALRPAAGLVAAALAVTVLVGSATTAGDPLLGALRGWDQPTATTVTEVVENADAGDPSVLWGWSPRADDRLANFWAALAWGADPQGHWLDLPGVGGGVAAWAYTADGTDDLCELARAVPGLDVHTRDAGLDETLDATCPGAAVDVRLDAAAG